MLDMWRTLRDYLKVEIETDAREVDDKDAPVTVRFTVTNSAGLPNIDTPEIVFEDVVLTSRTPAGSQEINLGSLDPEQSASHDVEMPFTDLMDMEYDVNGTVSPKAFLGVRRTGRAPGDSVSITIPAYLQMFEDLAVHQWLETTIREFPIPGPETTLAELTRLAEPLGQARADIQETKLSLTRIAGLVARQERKGIARLHRIVGEYLRNTTQGIAQIQQDVRSADQRKVHRTMERLGMRLSAMAERVDEETGKLAIAAGVRQPAALTSPEQPDEPPDLAHVTRDPKEPDPPESGGGSADAGGDDGDDYDNDGGRTPNDNRSDSMNPNNDAYQDSMDNRSDQMNPNNPNYQG